MCLWVDVFRHQAPHPVPDEHNRTIHQQIEKVLPNDFVDERLSIEPLAQFGCRNAEEDDDNMTNDSDADTDSVFVVVGHVGEEGVVQYVPHTSPH